MSTSIKENPYWQTIARDAHRGLRLPVWSSHSGGILSPYFQRSSLQEIGTGRNITILANHMAVTKALVITPETWNNDIAVDVQFYDGNTCVFEYNIELTDTSQYGSTESIQAYANTLILAMAVAQGFTSLTLNSQILWDETLTQYPMYVSGVAKIGTYAVTATPAVAGGAGVARFYVDTNGDGTGTAPGEIEIATLQAVVVNTSAAYVLGAVSVDTNRKYIDVTMKALTFTTGLAGILNVLTGANLTNATNGTSVNCYVIVKK